MSIRRTHHSLTDTTTTTEFDSAASTPAGPAPGTPADTGTDA